METSTSTSILDTGHCTLDTGHWTLDTQPLGEDLSVTTLHSFTFTGFGEVGSSAQCKRGIVVNCIGFYISNSEYLVMNPVQAALQSNKRLKANFKKKIFLAWHDAEIQGVQEFILDLFKVHS